MIPMVYLDHSATTPLDPEVLEAMMPYLTEEFGNASSVYGLGQRARQAIDQARDEVADFYGVAAKEVIFTSGGTEGDNFAFQGIARRNGDRGRHVITSTIEHDAVLRSAEALERDGFEVTRLRVDRFGLVDPDALRQALRSDTILVSIMHANNEIGTIEPIRELAAVTREHSDAYFHTDAVQSTGKIATTVDELGVDLLTMSAHRRASAVWWCARASGLRPRCWGAATNAIAGRAPRMWPASPAWPGQWALPGATWRPIPRT